MHNKLKNLIYLAILSPICSCKDEHLPYLGHPINVNGRQEYPRISDFSLIDQDSAVVTQNTLKDKIQIVDFIFLSCPTICPKMTTQMKTIYGHLIDRKDVVLLSFTIDPQRDSISKLKNYAENLSVSTQRWRFLTGNQDSILSLATHSYFSIAYPDSSSPGGFTHSGGILLVDKHRHLRGVYDGTDPSVVERLVSDVKILAQEQ